MSDKHLIFFSGGVAVCGIRAGQTTFRIAEMTCYKCLAGLRAACTGLSALDFADLFS